MIYNWFCLNINRWEKIEIKIKRKRVGIADSMEEMYRINDN